MSNKGIVYFIGIQLIFLFCFPVIQGQIEIQLPLAPDYDTVPAAWRGHNHGAFSMKKWWNNDQFDEAFSNIHPGIIRWPSGNKANNFNWRENINSGTPFNLKELGLFMTKHHVDLQIVANFGTSDAADAAEFVRFCNSTTPFYEDLRDSLLGSSSAFNVKYWEIGNEISDPWAFERSWLGRQDFFYYRSGEPPLAFSRQEADSLYYYGGSLWRRGWVKTSGSMDKFEAILGDAKYYQKSLSGDTIAIQFPRLDVSDTGAVVVYLTPGFDLDWANRSANQQQLYNSMSNPNNLLPLSEFSWTETEVMISPSSGINPGDMLLIEYNSTLHDGAFTYRDSMKNADPGIEVGYCVKLRPEQYESPQFQHDFAACPPDFMIQHSYSSKASTSLFDWGHFSEISYLVQRRADYYMGHQELWDQREIDWGIASDVGLSITEWNMGLYDKAPLDHPFRGIAGGFFVADYWANMIEKGVQDSIDFRAINHFALVASGNNFIHLFHANSNNFTLSPEGKAVTLLMETIGEKIFPVEISGMPRIEIYNQNFEKVSFDALEAWGGVNGDGEEYSILFINRDDENSYELEVQIPAEWEAKSFSVENLYGSMIDEEVFSTFEEHPLSGSTLTVDLHAFSITALHIRQTELPVDVDQIDSGEAMVLYPNPTDSRIYLQTASGQFSANIYNVSGQRVMQIENSQSPELDISHLERGVYFIEVQSAGRTQTMKIVKV